MTTVEIFTELDIPHTAKKKLSLLVKYEVSRTLFTYMTPHEIIVKYNGQTIENHITKLPTLVEEFEQTGSNKKRPEVILYE